MSKKLILVLIAALFFSVSNFAKAEIIINEFVANPDSGSEWIELLNTSSSEINLSGWNWTELASPGGETEHESSPKSLSGAIPAGGFFVFEMSNALNNSGDSIGIYNGTDLEDRVTFGDVGGYAIDLEKSDKGKSGAQIGGTWKNNQEPTKGTSNPPPGSSEEDEEAEADTSDDSTSGGSNNSSAPSAPPKKEVKPKVQIISPKIAHTGVPFILEGTGTGIYGEKISHGRYYWNFGDGDFREVKVTPTEKFSHTYFYPGDYEVVFEYYPDSFADVPDATAEITIKVVEPKVLISAVGDKDDFFIEISNETGHNADISNWVLLSDYKIFTLPKNTILASGKKTAIPPKVSNFSIEDKSSLKLLTPQREIVFDYALPLAAITQPPKSPLSGGHPKSSSPDKGRLGGVIDETSLSENLPALVSGSAALDKDSESFFASWIVFVIGLVFVGVSAFAVYYIRQKRVIAEAGGDFEILDE